MLFRSLAVVTLIAHATNCNISSRNGLNSFVNKWREDSQYVYSFLPSLEKINFETVESQYDGMGLRINFSIYGMDLIGLDSFRINSLKISQNEKEFCLDVNIEVPKIRLHSDHYKINGKAYYVYSLQGEGNMDIDFIDITAMLNLKARLNQSRIIVEDIIFDYDVKDIKVDLQKSPWPLNSLLNKQGIAMLKSYRDDIVNALRFYVVPYINDFYVPKLQPT